MSECGTRAKYAAGCRCDECRASAREYNREYAAANRERVRKWGRTRMEGMTEEQRQRKKEYMREWNARNRERRAEYARTYNEANAEAIKQQRREHYEENREVIRARAQDWYRENKDRARDSRLRRVYGLTAQEYTALLDAQGGTCAICLTDRPGDFREVRLCVDHDHDTGAVRGILCDLCNRGIGMLGDNAEIALRAADYLSKGGAA